MTRLHTLTQKMKIQRRGGGVGGADTRTPDMLASHRHAACQWAGRCQAEEVASRDRTTGEFSVDVAKAPGTLRGTWDFGVCTFAAFCRRALGPGEVKRCPGCPAPNDSDSGAWDQRVSSQV